MCLAVRAGVTAYGAKDNVLMQAKSKEGGIYDSVLVTAC